jgi:hypothetical protein
MSNRRNRPPNRWGCKPDGDVCVLHCLPLECRHGCPKAIEHKCAEVSREQGVDATMGNGAER